MYKNYASMLVGRDTQHGKEKTTFGWLLSMMLILGILFTGFNAGNYNEIYARIKT